MSPTPPVVFLDTETTGLHTAARPWEIALIRREAPTRDEGTQTTSSLPDVTTWLMVSDIDLSQADLHALKIGGFYERHPKYKPNKYVRGLSCQREELVARTVEEVTRGAVLVGSNPAYDARVLEAMLRRHGLCPAWHYRPVDLPTYAAGRSHALDPRLPAWPDWRSEQMALQSGASVPAQEERHTALGDARWIRDWWDALEAQRAWHLDEAVDERIRARKALAAPRDDIDTVPAFDLPATTAP